MAKKWVLKNTDSARRAGLAKELNVHPVIAQILLNRGINDPVIAASFLKPDLARLYDPFLLKDMDKAVSRLKQAVASGENVLVYGDYDVDGVTATAVVFRMLKRLNVKARTYIPHRMEEGYGLNEDIIPLAKSTQVSLIITVDCGITAIAEAAALKREGIDLIVIDHHEPEGDSIPDAVAVIDPKQAACAYPFKGLAGVGLAAKFVQAMTGKFPENDLDLVALGTIADVVPLCGENRIIVTFGLPVLTRTSKPGLRALIESARMGGKPMSPYSVGFGLGPRLNAAGRMGTANTSLDLLLCDDADNAAALAQALEVHNKDRQKLQSSLVDEAMAIIDADPSYAKDAVIVVYKEGWHKGVLGIAASKITDKFGKPSVVIAVENGFGCGSARSIEGFALNEAFAHCASLLGSFGGHERAAGLKLQSSRIVEFRTMVNTFAAEALAGKDIVPTLLLDAELPINHATMDMVMTLESLAPHGEGNPAPIFGTRRLMVKSRPQTMGKDTIKFWVTDGKETLSAVGFGMATEYGSLRMGQAIDIAYTLGIDDWNKTPVPQIMLKDLRILTK
ncbi:MAG: single-stranded-DNA-specific exonuclease RecJ [Candidatus Omnitrophica bacterium]|nr:single-stranded-DNA-specific exonuclease RecJ [Candidatus Omnitrophota bacterium]